MFLDYLLLALKNIRKRGIRSWLTMLGVFIGIAAVVSLISLGQGLETAITGQFNSLSTDTLTITNAETGFAPPGSAAIRKLTEHDLEIIESVQGIEIVIPRLLRVARVEYNKILSFSFIGSIPKDKEQAEEIYKSFNLETSQGRLLRSEDTGKVVLGDDYISDNFFEKEIRIGSKLEIQGKEFEVIGILKRTSTFTLNSAILMTEDDMKDLFDIDDEIDFIIAKVEDEDEIEEVAERIETELRKDRDLKEGEEDFQVQTPIQSLETVSTIINVVNIVVGGIAAISLLVGGIGIANTMFTSVLERRKEIGIMKAIGAKNKTILTIFIIESAFLGFVGGLIGVIIGLLLAFGVSTIANSSLGETIFTLSPSPIFLASALLFSILIGVISGIIPALQAARLNPVEALRK